MSEVFVVIICKLYHPIRTLWYHGISDKVLMGGGGESENFLRGSHGFQGELGVQSSPTEYIEGV